MPDRDKQEDNMEEDRKEIQKAELSKKLMEVDQLVSDNRPKILEELSATASHFDQLFPDYFKKAAPRALQVVNNTLNQENKTETNEALFCILFSVLSDYHPEKLSELSIDELCDIYFLLKENHTKYRYGSLFMWEAYSGFYPMNEKDIEAVRGEIGEEAYKKLKARPLPEDETLEKIMQRELINDISINNKEPGFDLAYAYVNFTSNETTPFSVPENY